jgi:hypothetical protein
MRKTMLLASATMTEGDRRDQHEQPLPRSHTDLHDRVRR